MRGKAYKHLPFLARTWVGVSICLTCTGCLSLGGQYRYEPPPETGDGWNTAHLSDKGMDPELFLSLMNRLGREEEHLIHGLLVVKDGVLVFEEYFDGRDVDLFDSDLLRGDTLNLVEKHFEREELHHCASVTKSVTSQLVGIALEQGFGPGVEAKLFSFFPDYAHLASPGKERISLHHMLAMTSGLPFDEGTYPIADPRNDAYQLFFNEDPVGFSLKRDVVSPPGTRYQYNSGTTVLLGEIIRRKTGKTISAFAREHLFGPLGISRFRWAEMPNAPGVTHAAGGLYLRPRDLAKIGQLMLQEGVWEGRRVLPSSWVRRSVTAHATISGGGVARNYGYQWKIGRFGGFDGYWAAGWGGQYLVVFPDLDLVFVQTAGRYGGQSIPLDYEEILQAYVLPATERG